MRLSVTYPIATSKQVREAWGKPMILTSAARSRAHNIAVGGNEHSFHVYDKPFYPTGGCCAVDVRITDSHERASFIELALRLGWSVGVNKKFVHIDRRIDYTAIKQMLFLY